MPICRETAPHQIPGLNGQATNTSVNVDLALTCCVQPPLTEKRSNPILHVETRLFMQTNDKVIDSHGGQ
jgi:hypothetical protein